MQQLNCLIVEDEPLAAAILRDYIADVPGLKLVEESPDVFKASEALRNHKVDVIFLDINLPKMNGLDFLKTLRGNYHIILTTAYHQYALDGFNLNVLDYLLKPIEFSRFLQAINKVYGLTRPATEAPSSPSNQRNHHYFNVDKKQVKVYTDEINYIESLKDYVRLHTDNGKISTRFQIGEMDELLADQDFLRIHKSFIVNVEKIRSYSATEMDVAGTMLPIGRTYKELVDARLKN